MTLAGFEAGLPRSEAGGTNKNKKSGGHPLWTCQSKHEEDSILYRIRITDKKRILIRVDVDDTPDRNVKLVSHCVCDDRRYRTEGKTHHKTLYLLLSTSSDASVSMLAIKALAIMVEDHKSCPCGSELTYEDGTGNVDSTDLMLRTYAYCPSNCPGSFFFLDV